MNKKKDLKPIPKGNKGLPKLPQPVREKIGFLKKGGSVARAMSESGKTISNADRKKVQMLLGESGKTISDADRALLAKSLAKPFKGKIDTDKEKLVSENGKTMVVKKAKGGSIQVSGSNFSGIY